MKTLKTLAMGAMLMLCGTMAAQTEKTQIVENGGTGDYKAVVVGDASCPRFTIYRPQDMKAAIDKEGRLPVILYANGACANNNLEIRYFLNEVASHGYLAVAIGPYDEDDFFLHWEEVMSYMYPRDKDVVLANGKALKRLTAEESQALIEQRKKAVEEAQKQQKKKSKKELAAEEEAARANRTYGRMLLEVLDWLTDQNADPTSEYYHCLNLDKVAAMGQSCGGAQTLAVSHDPRIKTCVILNSGIGDMEMQGVSAKALESLHTPMFYLIGGSDDVAFQNAQKDYDRIHDVPVCMINTIDGHEGTYYEAHGGDYAIAVTKWMDWQLKGKVGQAALFLDPDYVGKFFPKWTMVSKNF